MDQVWLALCETSRLLETPSASRDGSAACFFQGLADTIHGILLLQGTDHGRFLVETLGRGVHNLPTCSCSDVSN